MLRTLLTSLAAIVCLLVLTNSVSADPAPVADTHPVVAMMVEHAGQPLGKILIELFPEDAPISVANYIKLVNSKFYDGLTFHRITNLNGATGKIVQGGDPSGNGSGGPGWSIKGEFSANGVQNPLVHDAGAVAMARSGDPNSAGSQFYICVDPVHFLDGNYAVFGKVIEGLDIANRLQVGDKMTSVRLVSTGSVPAHVQAPPVSVPATNPTPAPVPWKPSTIVPAVPMPVPSPETQVDAKDRGYPLTWAAATGNLVSVKHLIANHAKVNAKDSDGSTALMAAALNGHVDVVKALIAAGANVNATDSLGETAVDYASSFPDVIGVLRAAKTAKPIKKP